MPVPASGATYRALLAKHRDLIVVTALALAVRLVWNLWIHPPIEYAYSDMGGYLERAQTSIDHPGQRFGYFTLFPWGTHVLLMLVKRAAGAHSGAAIGVLYAALGAGAVAYTFLFARRLTRRVILARAVAAALIVYYPWIALGGYMLSEPPFTFFLSAAVYGGLVLADRGRARDAWIFGLAVAAGAAFRPQILLALPLYAIHLLARRRAWRRASPRLAAGVIVPLAILFAVSAARMKFHTDHLGLISNNGPLNYAFGRCHALTISTVAPDRKSGYAPPSLDALARWEKDHPGGIFRLDPAQGTRIEVKGHIWDREPFEELAAACVRRTGLARQAAYAATHVVLLWGLNIPWPDQSAKPPFRQMMSFASGLHVALILPPALWVLAISLRRRGARLLLGGLHIIALALVAAMYFGDTRLRVPYDGVLITFAVIGWAAAIRWAKQRGSGRGSPATPAVRG